ncbi:MAG: methionine--tRNA ligase [Acidobacteria bacterium]|nr:MAG: methionine--tRNA ligase [Acidobacteriota bacterium]
MTKKKKKLITSALPYVNNVPHLGNIIGCVLSADVYARFCRSRGYETLYVCGTDEYGTATENKAREEGVSPRDICDKYHAIHKQIYRNFNISFDVFGRTSTPEQTEVAQSIFKDLESQGFIHEHTSQRTFCEHDDMFLADRFVEGTCPHCDYVDARGDQCDHCGKLLDPEQLLEPRCKICKNKPALKETTHLHFDLSQLQDELENWFTKTSKEGHWPNNAISTTRGWLERGLSDRPITRDLKWGVPVPKKGFEGKVFYVWFDAPIGYISITKSAMEDWERWWKDPEGTNLYQFMAKDNIPFHTVMFPASLIGTRNDWTLLHHISSTEYLNYEDTKFSKSRSVGVFGTDVSDIGIPTDLWRFYLLANRPEKNDSAFVWKEFFTRINSDFINNIGNMANRALVYLYKNFDGKIADYTLDSRESELIEQCQQTIGQITEHMEKIQIRQALKLILALGNEGNKYFQDAAPWVVIKEDRERAHSIVSVLVYLVRSLSILLEPFMPKTSETLWEMLRIEKPNWDTAMSFTGLHQHQINKPSIIYHNLDPKLAEVYRKKFSGEPQEEPVPQLVVGQITEIERHPEADRLYVVKVDTGHATRQLIAGMVPYFTEGELLNRKVLVVTNLKPAVIRGTESNGMIAACEKGKKLDLFAVEAEVGTPVDFGVKPMREITIQQFKEAGLKVTDGTLKMGDAAGYLDKMVVKTSQIANGKVR